MASHHQCDFARTNIKPFDSQTTTPLTYLHNLDFLCNPAFTEAAYVKCPSDAFAVTVRRLYAGAMDLDVAGPLQRTASHRSIASAKSQRSQTAYIKPRKYPSHISSSASSVSDKSLTSFPSFSPDSPRDERLFASQTTDSTANSPFLAALIVDNLTTSSPAQQNRIALFDDTPINTSHVPGAIHHANDEHIERLIARNGAVGLVRRIAEDLAQRDAQIASLRRKAEDRERALRKIILECGLSNLDLETKLRELEAEPKLANDSNGTRDTTEANGLEGMMNDAMSDTVVVGDLEPRGNNGTARTNNSYKQAKITQENTLKEAPRGWKDYIWGTGTSTRSSRGSSTCRDAVKGTETSTLQNGSGGGRPTVLQNDIFQQPDLASLRSPSRASSIQSGTLGPDRKTSSGLASLALKLVAGNTTAGRDSESSSIRGRSNSTGQNPSRRTPSAAPSVNSTKTTMATRGVVSKPGPKTIPAPRRTTVVVNNGTLRTLPQERWDTMGASPQSTTSNSADNYGPVEMDTILQPDAQPPTMTHAYNNPYNQEFLTDRFGFIYDQRRKKRQREAAEQVRKTKQGSRLEMLNSARGSSVIDDEFTDERPGTPLSNDERGEDGKSAKRWQDYLKIATFPTELLSHTPSGSVPAFEIMEGSEVPRSPGTPRGLTPGITTEERGFFPSASTTSAPPALLVTSDNATISKPIITGPSPADLAKEDAEPVKLLLQQLGEVHDSLQREKTVKWNDFLRKVRAERKRDGAAAAAAFAAAAETRSQRPMTIMPEVSLGNGEMIGVAGLGNKGKVGRAKWNEFKALVLGGIPVVLRAKIWAECSGATALRIPGYYDDLVAHREGEDDPAIVAQIQMDINRTLTDNIFFRKGPGVARLNEVLLAYSRRNLEVGYCQGMNLITACLLLIMPTAEETFWVLSSIIENILPPSYYDHSLLASRADQQVLRQYVAEILPKLSQHLDELNIELEALTFQWFLSVFTDCLSAEALFRVWDVVLCTNDGSTFLFQVALALLKLNEQQLLQCTTSASIYTYINHQMTNHAISIDGLIRASEGLRNMVKRDEVENRRTKAIEAEKDLIRQREARSNLRKAEKLTAANGNAGVSRTEALSISSPLKNTVQLKLDTNVHEELTFRAPMPVEEERALGLG